MKHRKTDTGYVLRMEKGDEIIGTLARFADEAGIGAGFITGIGAVCDLELGYFDVKKKEYSKKHFDGDYELINLTGNISLVESRGFVHAHVTISDDEFNVHAGHLFSGMISVTGEFVLMTIPAELHRAHDAETGLNLLDL